MALSLVKPDYGPPFEPSVEPYRFIPVEVLRDWDWLTSVTPCRFVDDMRGIVAIDRHGDYAAACILDNWTKTSVCGHWVILNPMAIRHGFLTCVCDFVFLHARKKMINVYIPSSNTKSLRLAKHIGMTELFRIPDGCDEGDDCVILELRRETCRWISKEK